MGSHGLQEIIFVLTISLRNVGNTQQSHLWRDDGTGSY